MPYPLVGNSMPPLTTRTTATAPPERGGSIGGNAAINVNTGNLSGDLFASINNGTASIVSDATINVTATSISAGAGGIDLSISDRNAGSIGGSANVNLSVNGSII